MSHKPWLENVRLLSESDTTTQFGHKQSPPATDNGGRLLDFPSLESQVWYLLLQLLFLALAKSCNSEA